ncbi:hypothetical protein BJF85_18475, partial [Saccharomonospora sp. CUA-673]|uniref:PPE domain-containing protein n=1 Tax=Saccharomonospora sp. CUA-673 TaxID=1904969 RepID=UPI00095CCAB8
MVAPFLIPAAGAYVYDSLANGEEAQRQSSTQGCIDAYQIYQKITSGRGTASLHEGQAASLELSNLHSQRATQISQINSTMASAWTGEGAESARMGAQPLQTWMGDASANLGTSGQVMSTQAGAFENARNNVQPLPAEPPENSWGNKLKPWETDLDRDIAEYNDNANKNVQVFNQYHDTSSQNAGQMPQYSTMSGAYGDVSLGESGVNGGRTGPVSINEPGGGGGQGTGGAGYQSPGVSSGGVQTPAASYPGGSTPGGGAGGGSYPGGPGGSYPGVPGGGGSSTYPTTPSPNDGTSSSNYNPNFPGGPGGGSSTYPTTPSPND